MKIHPEMITSHKLALDEQGVVMDTVADVPFPIHDYSDMKYGGRRATRDFASKLTDDLLEARPELVEDKAPPQFAVTFNTVPHVPFYLSRHALEIINGQREENGNEPGSILQVDKSRIPTSNYASLSVDERRREWATVDFSLADEDRPSSDAQVVMLDDIRITGAFTKKLLDVFEGHSPHKTVLGFVAIFDPAQALRQPTIEDHINGTKTKTAETILPLILADDFDLNIRTLKMILATEKDQLMEFLEQCPRDLVETMYSRTMASEPNFIDFYEPGHRCIKDFLQK